MAKSKKQKNLKDIEIINRKAAYEFFFKDTLEVGIMLTGTEVKSIKNGEANLKDAFCFFRKGELFLKNLFIAEFKYGNLNNHETRRLRKLLLKKVELRKWERKVKERGYTIIPHKIYLSERGLIKLEIVLGQGKKTYDKRETLKNKDNKRQMERLKKIRL